MPWGRAAFSQLFQLQPIETRACQGIRGENTLPARAPTKAFPLPLQAHPNASFFTFGIRCKFRCWASVVQTTSQKRRAKMSVASSSALSDLVNTSLSPFKPQTSVELLRFRQIPSGSLVRELCETLGDEVVDNIAGETRGRSNNHGIEASSTPIPEAEADAPFFQFV